MEGIRSEVVILKKSLMNLKFQKSTGQLEKTAEIKKTSKSLRFNRLIFLKSPQTHTLHNQSK